MKAASTDQLTGDTGKNMVMMVLDFRKLMLMAFVFCRLVAGRVISESHRQVNAADLKLGITVSSLVTTTPQRQMEVWWSNGTPGAGHHVDLYKTEPMLGISPPDAVFTVAVDTPDGWQKTGIATQTTQNLTLPFTKSCLGYWVGYVAENVTLAKSCLGTEPTWMKDYELTIGKYNLKQLFIPGTHDSGAYDEYYEGYVENIVGRYTYTQELNLLNQLIFGARYIDLRVACYNATPEIWWVNHGIVKVWPLKTVLDQVITFLNNTEEIVILDIQEFPVGFDTATVHEEFVQFLQNNIGAYMASPKLTWDVTLQELFLQNKKLLVGYDHSQTVASHPDMLWPAVSQKWGDKQTLQDLHDYLLPLSINPPTGPWSAMAELTPSLDMILDPKGLRGLADDVNHNVSTWYRGSWGETANVVAVDYIQGTSIVQEALAWNVKKVIKLHQ